jgi:hypothetical protein
VIGRAGERDAFDLAPLRQRESRWPTTAVARVQGVEPVGVEVVQHVATRSGLVNVTLAICGTGMACALSSTICALRQVTTDPVERRRIRNSR